MVAEESLYSLLSGTAGVTALVSTRIYPDAMPEGGEYPAVVFSRAETTPVRSISGQYFGADVILRAECWALTRGSADLVAAAISTALIGSDFVLDAREGGFDSESGLFATVLSISVFEEP